ncbi:MAG: YkvA family protein [Chloroflexota bacterium]
MDWRTVGGIGLGLLLVWAALIAMLWVFRPRDTSLGELIRLVPDLLRLVRGLVGDRGVPFRVRVALIGLLAWLISPIDLIPEFIPVLGPLDDVVVAVLVLRYVERRLGLEELRRRWPGTPEGFAILSRILGHTELRRENP